MRKAYGRRIIALVLSMALCITMSSTAAFAGTAAAASPTKLVVFGASTSTGYGLEDYLNTNISYNVKNNDLGYSETDEFGYKGVNGEWTVEKAKEDTEGGGRISRLSYPWKLKQYIAKQKYNGDLSKVNLNCLAMNGMRSDELRALLDPAYYEEAYNCEYNKTRYEWDDKDGNHNVEIGFLTRHIHNYVIALTRGGAIGTDQSYEPGTTGYKTAHEYVEGEIKNADVIVLDIAMNNFGTYMAERIISNFHIPGKENTTNYSKQKIEDITGITEETLKTVALMQQAIVSGNEGLNDPGAAAIMDAFMYCYADFLTNFGADIDMVRKLNPNAKIIVLGAYNTLNGINLVSGDKKIDLGQFASVGFNAVNAYLKAGYPNHKTYYYADAEGTNIETFMDQIGKAKSLEELIASDADGNELSPGGKTLMDNLYGSFVESFVGVDNLNAMIEQIAETQFNAAVADAEAAPGTLGNARAAFNQLLPLLVSGKDQSDPDNMTWADLYTILGKDDKYIRNMLVGSGNYKKGVMDEKTVKAQVSGGMDAIRAAVESVIRNSVQTVLFHAGQITDINMTEVIGIMGGSGMDSVTAELVQAMQTGSLPSNQTLQVLHLVDRFILYMAVGQHPSVKGCNSVYQCVKAAYDESVKGDTPIVKPVTKPAKVSIKKAKAGKKSIKVTWATVKGASGYQIYLKAKGKKVKTVTVKGGSKKSKTVKKLAAKKKYSVKVRAYKTVNGKKVYGAWSKTKKATTKK